MTARRRRSDAGLTLVEVLVSLSLFALIGIAGFAIVESVLTVRDRTGGRLDRLGDIQRAMHVIRLDFEQAGGGPLAFDGETVSLHRRDGERDGTVEIAYRAEGGTLLRRVRPALSPETVQRLLTGAGPARWRFWRGDTGWTGAWPPPGATSPGLPGAVEIAFEVGPAAPEGRLRRVVRLPGGDAP